MNRSVKHKRTYKRKSSLKNGGSGCGPYGCPIAPYPATGGGFYKPAAPLPPPFIGKAWGPKPSEWPGVDGMAHNRNYLAKNTYNNDPTRMEQLDSGDYTHWRSFVGGKKKRKSLNKKSFGRFSKRKSVGGLSKRKSVKKDKRRSSIKGGFLAQELVNFGRNIDYNINSTYNALYGKPPPVNPLPFSQSL